jgi:hypothetical protein
MQPTIATDPDRYQYTITKFTLIMSAYKFINIGHASCFELLSQAQNLAVQLKKKYELNEADLTTINALKTSIVMILFSVLEGYCNFIGELIVQSSIKNVENPKTSHNLSQIEIDYLSEQKTYIDKSGTRKIKKSVFNPTLDKLFVTPLILGKIFGIDFKIDKSCKEWQSLRRLKEIRDRITHIKFDYNGDNSRLYISENDIIYASEAIGWYFEKVGSLIHNIYKEAFDKTSIFSIRMSCWITQLHLYKLCNMSDKLFDKNFICPLKCDANNDCKMDFKDFYRNVQFEKCQIK